MLIVSVRDDENNRWKRNAKKKQKTKTKQAKTKKNKGVVAIAKGWELNYFVRCLS